MSFILDALKKLEQKRQQDSVPNLSTIHTAHLHSPKKRPLWPYLLLGALLLNAVILTVWLGPWHSESEDITASSPVAYNQEPPAVELSVKKEVGLPDTQPSNTKINGEAELLEIKPEPSLKPGPRPEQPAFESQEASPEVTESSTKEPETAASFEPDNDQPASLELIPSFEEINTLKETIREEQGLADSNSLYKNDAPADVSTSRSGQDIQELSEIPLELRKEIPDISIFGHIYSSSPSSRLANINGSLVREGDTVTGRLRVKEITVNGIVFDYQGTYFRMRAF